MRIISWNVNGLRALHRKNQFDGIFSNEPDIVCLQEVKAEKHQLPAELQNVIGYQSFFDHSKGRKGYSGVGVYVKEGVPSYTVEFGIGFPELDNEGRSITLVFKDFIVNTTYFPNGGGGPLRLDFKLRYYDAFLLYIEKHRKNGKSIIFCGDVNTAHTEIDLARPKENSTTTGFLPIERAWIDRVVAAGYVDAFRYLQPEAKDVYTYWDMKTFARERNVGWRIDYFFISKDLLPRLSRVDTMDRMFGSDHCPLVLHIKDTSKGYAS